MTGPHDFHDRPCPVCGRKLTAHIYQYKLGQTPYRQVWWGHDDNTVACELAVAAG